MLHHVRLIVRVINNMLFSSVRSVHSAARHWTARLEWTTNCAAAAAAAATTKVIATIRSSEPGENDTRIGLQEPFFQRQASFRCGRLTSALRIVTEERREILNIKQPSSADRRSNDTPRGSSFYLSSGLRDTPRNSNFHANGEFACWHVGKAERD